MYYTYVLRSQDHDRIYVGLTNNPMRRLREHNGGQVKPTKAYRPFDIILLETYSSLKEARAREKKLKQGCMREELKSIAR